MIRIVVALLMLAALLAGTPCSVAGPVKSKDSVLVVPETLREYYENRPGPQKLEYALDLWHDATLKGDAELAEECQARVDYVVATDLTANEEFLSVCARQALLAVESDTHGHADSSAALRAGQETFGELYDLYRAKRAVYDSFRKSEAFSNKARLLGDYIQLLRRELSLPRLKYALAEPSVPGETSAKGRKE